MANTDMTEFTESFGFIIFFLVMCLTLTMFFGDKVLFYFLVLILAGMVTVNQPKITSLIGRYV
jgi:hypothetical protein